MPELIPAAPGTPPVGWGSTEYAEHRAQMALEAWDKKPSLDRTLALATTLRTLLNELEIDRRMRRA